jgi:hypothetical protein
MCDPLLFATDHFFLPKEAGTFWFCCYFLGNRSLSSCEKRIVFHPSFGESDENRKKHLIFLAK